MTNILRGQSINLRTGEVTDPPATTLYPVDVNALNQWRDDEDYRPTPVETIYHPNGRQTIELRGAIDREAVQAFRRDRNYAVLSTPQDVREYLSDWM